jgi:hypothetical protein
MSYSIRPCTAEEFGAAMEKFQRSIAPAKIANSPRNGLLIAEYIRENLDGDISSQANIRVSVTKQRDLLRWDVKPASLLRDEKALKPTRIGESAHATAADVNAELQAKKDEAQAKIAAMCRKEIDRLIGTCPPVMVDTGYGRKENAVQTAKRKEGLRGLRATNTNDGSINWIETLRLVTDAVQGMDNDEAGKTYHSRHAERY